MYLTITKAAQEKIKKQLDPTQEQVLLLDFDDGVGALSRVGTCTLASVFRVLLADKQLDLHDYNERLNSDLGDFYLKGYTKMFMDDQMKLDVNPKTQILKLTGDNSGVLTAAVLLETVSAKRQKSAE
jgi:uncharacterized protein YqkB